MARAPGSARNRGAGLALLLGLAVAGTAAAAPAEKWIHIHVQEKTGDHATVRVNLPLSLVDAVLDAVETEDFSHGRIRLHDHDYDRVELRRLLDAVAEARDGEFVTVGEDGETVRVHKRDGYLFVHADERRHGREQVEVRMPIRVLQALVSGPEDVLDVRAAIRELEKQGEGELIVVDDHEDRVRIWVDRNPSSGNGS